MIARVAVALMVVTAAGACAKKPPKTTPEAVTPVLDGTSSHAFIFDPANPALNLPEDVKFTRPLPRERLMEPVYPADALAAGDGPHREVVRIVIDKQGKVVDVGDSPVGASDGGPHAVSFRTSVDKAVRTWVFQPGFMKHVEPGHDLDGDGKSDYLVATSVDAIAVYYDVRFTFEIVDGKGIVRKE